MRFIPLYLSNRGSATILMVFMTAVILTVGLGFNWLVKEHLQASESLKNKAEAIVMARSAYDTLIYLLLNGQVKSSEVILSGVDAITPLKALPLDGSEIPLSDDVGIHIQDSNGLLSVTNLNVDVMRRLIKRVMPIINPAVPVASLQDWTDPDDLTRVNGAEASYYKKEGNACLPRNYALQYEEELGFVRGLSSDGYARLRSSLTLLPSTGLNPNTASDDVLASYLDITEDKLMQLKAYRSKIGNITESALQVLTGRKLAGTRTRGSFTPSFFMEITVSAGKPKSMYVIKAGLSLRQNDFSPYSVLYWREE